MADSFYLPRLQHTAPVVGSEFESITTFGMPFRGRIDNGVINCSGINHSIPNSDGSIDGILMQNIPHTEKDRHSVAPTYTDIDYIEGFAWKDRLLMGSGCMPSGHTTLNPIIVDDRGNPIQLTIDYSVISSSNVRVEIRATRWVGRLISSSPNDEEFNKLLYDSTTSLGYIDIDLTSEINGFNTRNTQGWFDILLGIASVFSVMSPTWDKFGLIVNLNVSGLYDPPYLGVEKHIGIGEVWEVSVSGYLAEYEGESDTLEYSATRLHSFSDCVPEKEIISQSDAETRAKIMVSTSSVSSSSPSGVTAHLSSTYYSETVPPSSSDPSYQASHSNSLHTINKAIIAFYYDENGNRIPVEVVEEYEESDSGGTVFLGGEYTMDLNESYACSDSEECITYVPRTGCRCVRRCDITGTLIKGGSQTTTQNGSYTSDRTYYLSFAGVPKGAVTHTVTVNSSVLTEYSLSSSGPSYRDGQELVYDPCSSAPTGTTNDSGGGTAYAGSSALYNYIGGTGNTNSTYSKVETIGGIEVYVLTGSMTNEPTIDLNYIFNGSYQQFGLRIFGITYWIEGYSDSARDGGLHTDNDSMYSAPYTYAAYDPYDGNIVVSASPVSFL